MVSGFGKVSEAAPGSARDHGAVPGHRCIKNGTSVGSWLRDMVEAAIRAFDSRVSVRAVSANRVKPNSNGLAALEELKRWIRQNVSIVALEERALRLAGLPSPEVDEGFDAFCRELAEGVARTGMPERICTGFIIAAADIVRERMAEFQSRGTGHA
jgi:hypothetical protein